MQAEETKVQVPTAEEGLEDLSDPPVEGAVRLPVTIVPDPEEFFHGVFHDLLEGIGGGPAPVR